MIMQFFVNSWDSPTLACTAKYESESNFARTYLLILVQKFAVLGDAHEIRVAHVYPRLERLSTCACAGPKKKGS